MFLSIFLLFLASSHAEVYFEENFDDASSIEKWGKSPYEPTKQGKVEWSAGSGGLSEDKGLMTSEDAKFYWLTMDIPSFSNDKKTMVLQYSMRFDKTVSCGGSYLKLLGKKDASIEKDGFNGETPYHVMFGPDICGMTTKKVHVILNYKGKNVMIKKEITCKNDLLTHHYALILTPDNRYKVMIDCEDVEEGALDEDFDFLPKKKIPDPEVSKPKDWVDNPKMNDPNDKKPDVTKPDDWDDETDGDWEPGLIDNPDYKGEWKPKQIDNPDYKGPWVHPEIDNPDYKYDPSIYSFDDISRVGIEVWQVDSGSIYDNILITDDVDHAQKMAKKVCDKRSVEEEKKKEKDEKEAKEVTPEPDLSEVPEDDDGDDDAEKEDVETDTFDDKDEL